MDCRKHIEQDNIEELWSQDGCLAPAPSVADSDFALGALNARRESLARRLAAPPRCAWASLASALSNLLLRCDGAAEEGTEALPHAAHCRWATGVLEERVDGEADVSEEELCWDRGEYSRGAGVRSARREGDVAERRRSAWP